MNQNLIKNLLFFLLNKLVKKPKYLFFILLIAMLWIFYKALLPQPEVNDNMIYMGAPKIVSGIAAKGKTKVLQNEGYLVGYSEKLANPLWVSYRVSEQRFKVGKRPRSFSKDSRTLVAIKHEDYIRSGYSRGHMAPNYMIATRYGRSAQKETFLMTNISPQKSDLNRKAWQRLEEVIANDLSKWHGDFWVVTGPIFDQNPKRIKKTNIAIPKAFYKILIKPNAVQNKIKAVAFIFPQNAKSNTSLIKFMTSIDDVEKQSGIDFFSALDDSVEEVLEAKMTPNLWRLQEVANRPSRY